MGFEVLRTQPPPLRVCPPFLPGRLWVFFYHQKLPLRVQGRRVWARRLQVSSAVGNCAAPRVTLSDCEGLCGERPPAPSGPGVTAALQRGVCDTPPAFPPNGNRKRAVCRVCLGKVVSAHTLQRKDGHLPSCRAPSTAGLSGASLRKASQPGSGRSSALPPQGRSPPAIRPRPAAPPPSPAAPTPRLPRGHRATQQKREVGRIRASGCDETPVSPAHPSGRLSSCCGRADLSGKLSLFLPRAARCPCRLPTGGLLRTGRWPGAGRWCCVLTRGWNEDLLERGSLRTLSVFSFP